MNHRFALPAVIACSVHATLMFAFPRPPAVNRPAKPAEKTEPVEYALKPPEEKPDPAPADASGATTRGKPPLAPPSSPEPLPTKVPIDGLIMETTAPITPHIAVKTDKIMSGPFSPNGDPDGKPWAGETLGADVFKVSNLDRAPRTRLQAEPVYPHAMKVAGITGEVIVSFTVDESGAVLNPRVIRSTHADFEEPTLRAVARWRFEPGTKNMTPVRFSMTVPVVFNLGE